MLLLLDNHDSFTYNLAALLQSLGQAVAVCQPAEISPGELLNGPWQGVVISPGPGHPAQCPSRQLVEALLLHRPTLPILGICLGHQLLGLLHDGSIQFCEHPVHGHVHAVRHTGEGLFDGLPTAVQVMRYHSLSVDAGGMGSDWAVDARTDDAEQAVMALRHRHLPLDGLQFHPESVGTALGADMLRNWLQQRFRLEGMESSRERASLSAQG